MKLILSLLLITPFLPQLSYAGNSFHWPHIPSLSELKDKITTACEQKRSSECLKAVLDIRCIEYAKYLNGQVFECLKASGVYMDAIQMQRDEHDGRWVLYPKEIIELMDDSKVVEQIKNLSPSIDQSEQNGIKFNLWSYLKKQNNYDIEKTLMILGALFQEPEVANEQLKFTEWKGRKLSPALFKIMNDAKNDISIDRLINPEEAMRISAYPDVLKVSADLNPNYEHFYFPAYGAFELLKQKFSLNVAEFIPFMFNTIYEIYAISENQSWVYEDPANLEFLINDHNGWKLRDIYAGYVGSKFGTGDTEFIESFSQFEAEFAKSPRKFIGARLKKF